MDKLFFNIILLSVIALQGCSSTSESKVEDPIAKEQESERKRAYIVTDYSRKEIPTWIDLPHTGDDQDVREKYRYFIAESENKNKRLCLRSSSARASGTIAREIAQFMKNSYSEAIEGGEHVDVTEYMQEQLAQEAQTFIIGVEEKDNYWEQRRYLKERGAINDRTSYYCYTLVRMNKKNLSSAIKNSKSKLLTAIKDSEAKQNAQKALVEVEKKFNELENPVEL